MDSAIAVIAGAIAIGAISPGPSFVLVLRTSIALSRRDGLANRLLLGKDKVGLVSADREAFEAVVKQIAVRGPDVPRRRSARLQAGQTTRGFKQW